MSLFCSLYIHAWECLDDLPSTSILILSGDGAGKTQTCLCGLFQYLFMYGICTAYVITTSTSMRYFHGEFLDLCLVLFQLSSTIIVYAIVFRLLWSLSHYLTTLQRNSTIKLLPWKRSQCTLWIRVYSVYADIRSCSDCNIADTRFPQHRMAFSSCCNHVFCLLSYRIWTWLGYSNR